MKANMEETGGIGPKTWFTADTHFGHANIIKHCNRPWPHIAAHDEALIARWNEVVGESDTAYVIGDFAYRSARSTSRSTSHRPPAAPCPSRTTTAT